MAAPRARVLEVAQMHTLRFVDVVNLQCLQNLRFAEVSNASLGHHRNRHRLLNLLDFLRILRLRS